MELEKVEEYVSWFGGTLKNVKYNPKKKDEDGEEES
jgi:hypothetical protein